MWPEHQQARAPVHDFPPRWASAWGDDRYGLWADLAVQGVVQRMRWIEPTAEDGFWMGSTQEERDAIQDQTLRKRANETEHPRQNVTIEKGYWLADTPCTQDLFEAVTGKNPSHFDRAPHAYDLPIEWVPFKSAELDEIDVWDFLHLLNRLMSDGHARLPKEHEWEYAARSDGSIHAYWWGDRPEVGFMNANVDGKKVRHSSAGTTRVKQHLANRWGLFDMNGNVWEWTESPWRPVFGAPASEADYGQRVIRGGSWLDHPDQCRSAVRMAAPLERVLNNLGFRFLIEVEKKWTLPSV